MTGSLLLALEWKDAHTTSFSYHFHKYSIRNPPPRVIILPLSLLWELYVRVWAVFFVVIIHLFSCKKTKCGKPLNKLFFFMMNSYLKCYLKKEKLYICECHLLKFVVISCVWCLRVVWDEWNIRVWFWHYCEHAISNIYKCSIAKKLVESFTGFGYIYSVVSGSKLELFSFSVTHCDSASQFVLLSKLVHQWCN